MSPLRTAARDYLEAARLFSRPARALLVTELLAWAAQGIFYVLYNLYLVEGGFSESFVGRVTSVHALGLAAVAIPAGMLADRWGRRRTIMLGTIVGGSGLLMRSLFLDPVMIYSGSLIAGAGHSLMMIAAAPFMAEFSTEKERTHLFGAFFSLGLVAAVLGSMIGGWLPIVLGTISTTLAPDQLHAYRYALLVGTGFAFLGIVPMLRLRGLAEAEHTDEAKTRDRKALRPLVPIAVNSFLIGCGAGLVMPFMNLYFANRFASSSGEIGVYFSIAQVFTALAALLTPMVAARFGKLRGAVGAQLLSLPFLVTLGFENHIAIALGAFWLRATLMQSSIPLVQAFVMETLPPSLRARSMSLNNLCWHIGWAISATVAGILIERYGFTVPFYLTAFLYGVGSTYFYFSFRRTPEQGRPVRLSEEAKGLRSEGTFSE